MLLFIVNREEPNLYEALRREFAGERRVEVIIDRRFGEQRREQAPFAEERRRGERRTRAEADAHLRAVGWAVVRQADPAE